MFGIHRLTAGIDVSPCIEGVITGPLLDTCTLVPPVVNATYEPGYAPGVSYEY